MLLQESVKHLGFNLNYTSVYHSGDTRAKNRSSINANVSFKYSSLNKVFFILQDQRINGSERKKQFSISNRSTSDIRNFSISVGGQKFPQRGISMGDNNFGEPMVEHLLANNLLNDIYHQSSFNCNSGLAMDKEHVIVAQNKNQINYIKKCGWDKHKDNLIEW